MKPLECSDTNILAFPVVRHCDTVGNGAIRLSTCFYYPDTSQIDVFVQNEKSLVEGVWVSDFGQTADMLMHIKMPPYGTKKRKQIIDEICQSLGVDFTEGCIRLYLRPEESGSLPDAILRVAQACMRISDLYMTKRLYAPSGYREAVEEFFSEMGLRADPDFKVPSPIRKEFEIDFLVHGRTHKSLVQTLSTGNAQSAHHMSLEAYAKWNDIEPSFRDSHSSVTVWDSTSDAFRDEDIHRLYKCSEVFAFPAEADALAKRLAA